MNAVRYGLLNLVRVAQAFPATPKIMAELGQLMRDPEVGLETVADQLKHDSTLAARLLRIANSAVFAPGEPVASIAEAAARIGLQEVHRLVGAVAVDHFSLRNYPLFGFTGPQVRNNALLVALVMEELAVPFELDPPTAYSTGLFRSFGKLVLAKVADEGSPGVPFPAATDVPLVTWEKQTFGLTGSDATATILRDWQFPPEVPAAISNHYSPGVTSHPLAHLLNLAAFLADNLGHGLPGESAYWRYPAEYAHASGISPRDIQHVTDRAATALARINRALG